MPAIAAAKTLIQKETGTTAGTGTISSTGTAVTGSGTDFTNELEIGDIIKAGGHSRVVTAIASGTSLTVAEAWPNNISGQSFTIVTFTNITGATDLTGPAQQASQIDVSEFSTTGYRSQISGLRDPGALDFTLWYQPKDAVHAELLSDFDAGTVLGWRVWIPDAADGAAPPDTANSRLVTFGSVNQLSKSASTDGAWQASTSILLSGKPFLIVGVDA